MNSKKSNLSPVCYSVFKTAIRWCGLLRSKKGIIIRLFVGYKERDQLLKQILHEFGSGLERTPATGEIMDKIKRYCSGEKIIFEKNDLNWSLLTPFQQKVFKAAMRIPYGTVETYASLARKAGCPNSSRAVGNALARNPFPLLIPCHRIVRGDGKLGGFSAGGGIALKRKLLELEKLSVANRIKSGAKKGKGKYFSIKVYPFYS